MYARPGSGSASPTTETLVRGDPNRRTTTDEARVVFPKTAPSASQTFLSSSPRSPPANARNQNRRLPLTDGGRNSACLLAPPIQRGVTASSSTSSDLRPAMAFRIASQGPEPDVVQPLQFRIPQR